MEIQSLNHFGDSQVPHKRDLLLLVEDSPTQAVRTRLVLEEAGFDVQVCSLGSMALAFVTSNAPDLILLDMYLPDMNGREVAQRLKADPLLAGIPIIFITGVFSDVEDMIQGLEQGADDYLLKSVGDGELIARIRASLRTRRTQRELAHLARLLLRVNQVGNRVAGILDFYTLVNSVVRLVHEAFDYPQVNLFLVQGEELIIAAAAGPAGAGAAANLPRVSLESNTLAAESVRTRTLKLVSDAQVEQLTHPFVQDFCSGAAAPLHSGGRVSGVLEIVSTEPAVFTPNDGLVLATLADMTGLALHNSHTYQAMEELAMLDSLTGLLNRRIILERLEDEWQRSRRYERSIALITLDIDKFKFINDGYGHAAGDRAIAAVAQLLQHMIRTVDLVGRLGGDEFLIVLPETKQDGALDVAQRLSKAARTLSVEAEDKQLIPITLSLGVASHPEVPSENPAALLRAADEALYRAKAAGRNRASS